MITIIKMKKNDNINCNNINNNNDKSIFNTKKTLKARDTFTRHFIVEREIPF